MKNTLKKVMVTVMAFALLVGALAVPTQQAQAAKYNYTSTYSILVGKKMALSHYGEGKAKWKVAKGQKNIKILKQDSYRISIKGLKKGTAVVEDIFEDGTKGIIKVNVIGKTITKTYKGKKFSKSQQDDMKSAGDAGAQIKMVVKKGVKSIGKNAFNQLPITEIKIPNGVKSIGKFAFNDCGKLKSIKLPSSVKSIESYAFQSCESLKSINIPNGVTSIKKCAFYGCGKLKSVKLPNSVKSIGEGAFGDCEKLESVKIPDSVKSIGKDAFSSSALKSINIPNGVTSIGESAFLMCKKLTSVTIPDSVTSIGDGVFRYCDKLKSITWKGVTYNSVNDFEAALK